MEQNMLTEVQSPLSLPFMAGSIFSVLLSPSDIYGNVIETEGLEAKLISNLTCTARGHTWTQPSKFVFDTQSSHYLVRPAK